MSDKYDHWLGKLLAKINRKATYAITIGQTVCYSCPESEVDDVWRRHEDHHKEQYRRHGIILFLAKYIWYQLKYGYEDNPLEVEARTAAVVKKTGETNAKHIAKTSNTGKLIAETSGK